MLAPTPKHALPAPAESQPPARGEDALLNHLRFVALSCRSKPRGDLFEACAMLSTDRHASIAAHSDALMRCLGQALETRVVLYRPGTAERSFDESWLLRLAAALTKGDVASADFLLRSRVEMRHHRHLRFLVSRISDHFRLI